MKTRTQNVLVRLTVEGVEIQGAVALPAGRLAGRVLLPALRRLTDAIVGVAWRRMEEGGEKVTCRKGCDACCRQMVPIAPVEASALAEYLDNLPAAVSAPSLSAH